MVYKLVTLYAGENIELSLALRGDYLNEFCSKTAVQSATALQSEFCDIRQSLKKCDKINVLNLLELG